MAAASAAPIAAVALGSEPDAMAATRSRRHLGSVAASVKLQVLRPDSLATSTWAASRLRGGVGRGGKRQQRGWVHAHCWLQLGGMVQDY
jgi:hypothetical protein